MRAVIACLAFLLSAIAAGAAEQPAGNIITYTLAGDDLAAGKPVLRKGGGDPLAPEIYMPLFEGDVIVLDDPASVITIDVVNEPRKTISGPVRYGVVGKLPMTDDWLAISISVFGVVRGGKDGGGDTELVSKGFGISLPSAAAGGGTNLLLADGDALPLIWQGGKGPFAVFLDAGGAKARLGETPDRNFRFTPPRSGRFTITIEDSETSIGRLRFDVGQALPAQPEGLLASTPSQAVAATLLCAWLAKIDGGIWRLEAMRRLDVLAQHDDAARRLLDAMAGGWPQ